MSSSLFSSLEKILVPGESLRFTMQKRADGLALLLQPIVAKAQDVPKEVEQIRAALSLPLRIAGSATELDATFNERVQGYADARQDAHGSYAALLGALREASKEAKAKAPAKSAPAPKPSSSTASAAPAKPVDEAPPPAPAKSQEEFGQPLSLL